MRSLRSEAGAIHVNLPLPWNVYNSQNILILKKGYVLKQQRHIDMLLDLGAFIDDAESGEIGPLITLNRAHGFEPFRDWDSVYHLLGQLLDGHIGSAEFQAKVYELVAKIGLLAERDPDVAIFIMVQMNQPRYAISHSLQTAFLCSLIAQHLEWGEAAKVSMVAAALTMNIAMIELQTRLSRQSEPPTEAQRAEIHSHPSRGRHQLEALGVTDMDWLQSVENHHESADGAGYPRGITTISEAAKIIRDCDKYWAMASPRDYRKALPPNEVARALFMNSASPNDSAAASIIRELGIYPPGCYVRLANGEQAVVTGRGAKANAPKVCSFRNGQGDAFIQPLRRNTAQAEYAVAAPIPSDQVIVALNHERLFGYGGYQV